MYDSYIRAIRWASNRMLRSEDGGVICYVTNGGYLDANNADGLRLSLVDEFHDIYVYNLRGNQRTAGEQSRKEGGKVFDSGSRATVAILLLVKRPGTVDQARLHYKDIGDYLTRDEKLQLVGDSNVGSLNWDDITPNAEGDWINQRNEDYEEYPPIAVVNGTGGLFDLSSKGLTTNRDRWVYNFSKSKIEKNTATLISTYNAELERAGCKDRAIADPTRIKWSRRLESRFHSRRALSPAAGSMRQVAYRPFNREWVYFDKDLNEDRRQIPRLFPDPSCNNVGIMLTAPSSHYPEFSALMTDALPDLHLHDSGQFFARYSYVEAPARGTGAQGDLFSEGDGPSSGFTRVDNITDWALGEYRAASGPHVSKDDIFYYVYGLLHSPEYRDRYAADLKKSLPRIPQVPGRDRFEAFAAAGRALSELHIGYEQVDPYPMTEVASPVAPEDEYERFTVTKMKYGGKAGAWDKTRIRYNSYIDLEDIPEDAQRYMLGSRSGLDWILERYQVKTDKPSGIVNDPNDWSREHEQPRYIIDLIGRIVTVSLETMRIVDGLPELGLDH